MKTANVLRKRVFIAKLHMLDWVKQRPICKGLAHNNEDETFYCNGLHVANKASASNVLPLWENVSKVMIKEAHTRNKPQGFAFDEPRPFYLLGD
jgi:hypothetical protein